MGYPTVFPTGVTLYLPDLAWSGYTLLQAAEVGALLIDPLGREVQLWKGLQGFPNKLLPRWPGFWQQGATSATGCRTGSDRSCSGRLGW